MIEVIVDRLIEMAGIDTKEIWSWPDASPLSLEEVLLEKSNGKPGSSEPYGDTWKHPVKVQRDKSYHISRIIYFIDHPQEIAGIEVDNPCVDNGILPGCEIIDGWHRIAAAIILKLQKIWIDYGGRADIEDYICGRTEIRPKEPLLLDIPLY